MKKMKFAVWFTALMAVFTFSSCLNSDGENTQRIRGYVKVDGFIGNIVFSNQLGEKFNPKNQDVLKLTEKPEYAWIVGTFDANEQTQNAKVVDIFLEQIAPSFPKYIFGSVSEMMEGYSNAPITLINTGTVSGVLPISFWDKYMMFLPINYYVEQTEASKQTAELNQHSFEVFYDLDNEIENNKVDAQDDDLVLYVRHHVADPSRNNKRKALYSSIYHLDIRYALSAFSEKNGGATPKRIFICYDKSDEYNLNGDDKTATPNGGFCEIDYKLVVEVLDKMNSNR